MKHTLYFCLLLLTIAFFFSQDVYAVTIDAVPQASNFGQNDTIKINLTIDGFIGGRVHWIAHGPDGLTFEGIIEEFLDNKKTHEISRDAFGKYGTWTIDYLYGDAKETALFIVDPPESSDSVNEIVILSKKGVESYENGNYTEAITYFDKILKIDPNNVAALNNKGNAIVKQGNSYAAISYFNKALKIDPNNPLVRDSLLNAQVTLPYYRVDGFVEAQVRDSEGRLVAFFKNDDFRILNSTSTKKFFDRWGIEKVINYKGKEIDVIQFHVIETIVYDAVIGQYRIADDDNPRVAMAYRSSWGYPVEKGDTVTTIFTMFKDTS